MCNKRQKCETMSFSIQTKELFSCTFKGIKEILVILQKAKKKDIERQLSHLYLQHQHKTNEP